MAQIVRNQVLGPPRERKVTVKNALKLPPHVLIFYNFYHLSRCWETVTKLAKPKENDTDTVSAIAIYRRLLHYDVIVMVRQFRPPLNAYTVEFPAGRTGYHRFKHPLLTQDTHFYLVCSTHEDNVKHVYIHMYTDNIINNFLCFFVGLLDSGESCEQAAIRKLREETGWHGEVTHASDLLAVDAGCSSAVMRYATVKVILKISRF